MTKKHDYSLCTGVPIGGKWQRINPLPLALFLGFYSSDKEAIDGLRKAGLNILCHDICSDSFPFTPTDLNSQTYLIYDETDERVVSVFTLEVRLKEEKI